MPRHPSAHGAFRVERAAAGADVLREANLKRADARAVGGDGGAFVSELRPAAERGGRDWCWLRRLMPWAGRFRAAARRAITRALVAHLKIAGRDGADLAADRCNRRGGNWSGEKTLTLCDTTPRALLAIAGERRDGAISDGCGTVRAGPGAFKIDYALSEPVPWRAGECGRAITVHLGGTFEEIAAAEEAVAQGRMRGAAVCAGGAADALRCNAGAGGEACAVGVLPCSEWIDGGYDGADRGTDRELRAGISRIACWSGSVLPPATLEGMDANLVGGDISGGAMNLGQFFFRPSRHFYRTGTPGFYLCSASTPPGGGVHGMCGANAARVALQEWKGN